jgi:DNA-directed RNA polymerase specialized sigma24 family protein
VLDEAINEPGEEDRTAILLWFYERRDLRSVGEALGSSENAAQKRVTRALEQLHLEEARLIQQSQAPSNLLVRSGDPQVLAKPELNGVA